VRLEYALVLGVGDVVGPGAVEVFELVLEGESLHAEVLPQLLHQRLVFLCALHFACLVLQGVLLHVVRSVQHVTGVHSLPWVVLQHFGRCDLVDEYILVEVIVINGARILH
jgi:hypothetical protein